jgi:hypothetical protein
MTSSANGAFAPVLRAVEQGLTLPIPARVRILRELGADLEELMDRFVDEGLPPDKARAMALDALVPDPVTLEALGELHSPLYRRVTRRMSTHRVRLAERSLLVVSTLAILVLQAVTLFRANLLQRPSLFLVPVLLSGGVVFGLVVWKAFRFWIKKDHFHPGSGLRVIFAASGVTLALGICGFVFDFYWLAVILERSPELASTLVSDWLIRDSALLLVAILIALSGGLAWFVLSQWLAWVTGARHELLGSGPTARSVDKGGVSNG